MFKKIIAILLVGLMLHPGYAFAQDNDSPKPSLRALQAQAAEAYNSITERLADILDPGIIFSAVTISSAVGGISVLVYALLEDSRPGYLDLIKFKNKYELDLLDSRPISQEYWNNRWAYTKSEYIEKEFARFVEAAEWNEEFVLKELTEHGYSAEESSFMIAWIREVRNKPKALSTPRSLLKLFSKFEKTKLPTPRGNYLFRVMSARTLYKSGLLGVGLLLLSTTANAAPNDAKITERIMNKPELFLKASTEDLQVIEQNPMAEELCRTYANGLIAFSKLSPEKQKAAVEEAVKMNPQHRAKVDVSRSLRTVQAR